jgi:hypothetical protein
MMRSRKENARDILETSNVELMEGDDEFKMFEKEKEIV